MSLLYLGAILVSFACMMLIDHRFKLAFFYNQKRTLITMLISTIVFVIWDICGISLGIFKTGASTLTTGIDLGPEFPLEEIFFLAFLCYFTLILYRLLEVTWKRT